MPLDVIEQDSLLRGNSDLKFQFKAIIIIIKQADK